MSIIVTNYQQLDDNLKERLKTEINVLIHQTGFSYKEKTSYIPAYQIKKCICIFLSASSMSIVRSDILGTFMECMYDPIFNTNLFTGNYILCLTINEYDFKDIKNKNPKKNAIKKYSKLLYDYLDSLGVMYETHAISFKCKYESRKNKIKLDSL
jgi:hypothetical protein